MCQPLAAEKSNFRTSRNKYHHPHYSLNSHQPVFTASPSLLFLRERYCIFIAQVEQFQMDKIQVKTVINSNQYNYQARQRINKKHNRQRTTAAVGQH